MKHKIKLIGVIGIMIVYLPVFSQKFKPDPKQAFGVTLTNVHYRQYDWNNKTYIDEWDEFYSSSFFQVHINYYKTLNNMYILESGFGLNYPSTVVISDSLKIGIAETFIEIPLMLNITGFKSRLGFNPVHFNASLGLGYNLLGKQQLFTEYKQSLPYANKIKFGGYSKLTMITDLGAEIFMSDGFISLIVGWRSTYDLFNFLQSDKVEFTPNYYSWGFYTTLKIRFWKKELI